MATTAAKDTRADRWRKLSRRATIAGIVVVVLGVLFLLLLPVWICNDQGRAYILDRMNARLNGPRISVDKWSVGWFRSTDLTNVRIVQPDGTEMLFCPHVSSGISLWDLLRGSYDLRNTTADKLELRLTKFADGSASMDSLGGALGNILHSARGAVQIRDGRLTIASSKTGQVVRFVDVRATVTFAAPEVPLQLQLSAVGDGTGINGTGSVTINGTFPPSASLNAQSIRYPGIWSFLGNIDLTASRVPTALVCDYAGVDSAWADSFGGMLESVQISSHPTAAADQSRLSVAVHGSGAGPDLPAIDALLLLTPPGPIRGAARRTGTLAIAGHDYHAAATLRWSAPLAALLGRLNPVLGEAIAPSAGVARIDVTALNLPLQRDRVDAAELTARASFPALAFVPHEGPSMVRQLEVITGEWPATRAGAASPLSGSAGALRLTLADRRFEYENFLVTLGRRKLNFQGQVGLDGALDLSVLIPDAGAESLAAGASRVAVGGTVDSPLVKRAP